MIKFLPIILLVASNLVSAQSTNKISFVAPPDHPETPGSDLTGNGSFESPWATFQRAIILTLPGDTVYFRGGTYYSTETTIINPRKYRDPRGFSGTAKNPICYFGYPPDVEKGIMPIFDCSLHCDLMENANGDIYNAGIAISYVEYIHFKDFKVKNVFQCDPVLTGAISAHDACNLTFEHIIIHDVGQRGYWIQGGVWNEWDGDDPTDIRPPGFWGYASQHPDTTRWINCDVYNLCDSITIAGGSYDPGNGADAWKTWHYKGNVVSFEGCRAWNYSDDGFDLNSNGAIRILDNCWVMSSNKYKTFLDAAGGIQEGNGFKIPGALNVTNDYTYDPNRNTVIMKNCIATYCKRGFYELDGGSRNRNNGIFYNNTAIRCGIGFIGADASDNYPRTSIYRNNNVYASTSFDPGLGQPYHVSFMGPSYAESNNTWDWKSGYPWFEMSDTFHLSDQDFVFDLDSTSIVSMFTTPRQQDGSLPSKHLFALASNSQLIDAGIDVGLSYTGPAPDIGAFEYGSLTIEITTPSDNTEFTIGEYLLIKARIVSPVLLDSDVKFFMEQTGKELEVSSHFEGQEWQCLWKIDTIGHLSFRASVENSMGEIATSSRVNISVDSVRVDSASKLDPENDDCLIIPNPNNGNFYLELNEPLEVDSNIHIMSMDGRCLVSEYMQRGEFQKEFNLSGILPSGLYFLLFANKSSYKPCDPVYLLYLD